MKRLQVMLVFLAVLGLSSLCWNASMIHAATGPMAAFVPTPSENPRMSSDTHFVDIDLAYVQLDTMLGDKAGNMPSGLSRGVEPSPFIVWRNDVTHESGAWIMTLNSGSGAQMGNRLHMNFLKSWYPVAVLWAQHFAAQPVKGIEPSPWIVFRDFRVYTFPVRFRPDGTPVAGAAVSYMPGVDSTTYGHALSAAELPGTEFADGIPRMFIGTDLGYIIVLIKPVGSGVFVADILSISSEPIIKLMSIPQCDYVALGALTGDLIRGIQYKPGVVPLGGKSFTEIFTLVDPRMPSPLDLAAFGPDDSLLADCQAPVRLILANGSHELALTGISANQTGTATLTLATELHSVGVRSAVTGSLLMLATDESAVMFDPHYSAQSGSSGCDLNIGDDIADECVYMCGDANGDGISNVSDAVYIINYVFAGGNPPNPMKSGDANCDTHVNVSDAVWIINYVFAGGHTPCDTNGNGLPDC